MPCEMTYNYNMNLISGDALSGYQQYGVSAVSVPVKVYQFGNVDGTGAMALTYVSGTYFQYTIKDDVGLNPEKYPAHQALETHVLSGWFPCHCGALTPKA